MITLLLWKPGVRKRSLVFKRVLKCVRDKREEERRNRVGKRDAERVTKTESRGKQWE